MKKHWNNRNWEEWLTKHLNFPFQAERVDDEDYVYFSEISRSEPFRLNHVMKVVGIDSEDDFYGILVKVREGRRTATIPLIDLEPIDRNDQNLKYIEEYGYWFVCSRS